MNAENTRYPDISAILAAKQQRRRELAALSWEEKVAIIEMMRQLRPRDGWRRDEKQSIGQSRVDLPTN